MEKLKQRSSLSEEIYQRALKQGRKPWEAEYDLDIYKDGVEHELKELEYIKEALEKRLATLEKNNQKTEVLTENEGLKNHIAELNKSIAKLKRKMENFEWHPKNPKMKMQEIVQKTSNEQENIKEALEKRLAALEKNNQKTKVLTESKGLKNHIAELNKQITEFREELSKLEKD